MTDVTASSSAPKRITFVAGAIWLLTLFMGLATLWAVFAIDVLQASTAAAGVIPTADQAPEGVSARYTT